MKNVPPGIYRVYCTKLKRLEGAADISSHTAKCEGHQIHGYQNGLRSGACIYEIGCLNTEIEYKVTIQDSTSHSL